MFARTLAHTEERLAAVDRSGDARRALANLIATSWKIVFQFRALLAAAETVLPAERIRHHHDQPLTRVRALIERGQRQGVFRTDLPSDWLVTVFYTVLHGAANEVAARRLQSGDAGGLITATLLGCYSTPGAPIEAERHYSEDGSTWAPSTVEDHFSSMRPNRHTSNATAHVTTNSPTMPKPT